MYDNFNKLFLLKAVAFTLSDHTTHEILWTYDIGIEIGIETNFVCPVDIMCSCKQVKFRIKKLSKIFGKYFF